MRGFLIILLWGFMAVSCATFSDQYKSGKAMPQEQVDRISNAYQNGEIKIGMTKEEVISLIGKPSIRQATIFGGKEIWTYTSHSSYYCAFLGFSRPLELHFDKDSKLISIHKRLKL